MIQSTIGALEPRRDGQHRDDNDLKMIPCPVEVCGNLRDSPHPKVQVLGFDQFDGLGQIMAATRERIESIDKNDKGDDDNNQNFLWKVHLKFSQVVKEIILHRGLDVSAKTVMSDTLHVSLYARPTVRSEGSAHADFLHNDKIFYAHDLVQEENAEETPLAMVNVWMILNDRPPKNHLVFLDIPDARCGRTAHILHPHFEQVEGKRVFYDKGMCWGSFYCFVSGEPSCHEQMLVHGALDIDGNEGARRSIEMRFLIHQKAPTSTAGITNTYEEDRDDEDEPNYGEFLFQSNSDTDSLG